MKMKCTKVELLNEDMVKNPCLRLTYIQEGLSIAAAQDAVSVVKVLSGNNFDKDNKPVKADNLAWCKSVMDGIMGSVDEMASFDVSCDPIVRKNNDGKYIKDEAGKVKVYNTFSMWQYAVYNADTESYDPIGGMDKLKRRADNMIANSSRVETVAAYKVKKAARNAAKAAEAAAKVVETSTLSASIKAEAEDDPFDD